MKTITISDETYARLGSIKAGRSFSETIDEVISSNVGVRIDKLNDLSTGATGREDELARVVEGIRKRTKARTVEAPPRH